MRISTEEPALYQVPMSRGQIRKQVFTTAGEIERSCFELIQLIVQIDSGHICSVQNQKLFTQIDTELANLPDSLTVDCLSIKEN